MARGVTPPQAPINRKWLPSARLDVPRTKRVQYKPINEDYLLWDQDRERYDSWLRSQAFNKPMLAAIDRPNVVRRAAQRKLRGKY